ncbi:hypothetical protein BD779DRAFT_1464052, partial [Infundibulicybe gibba]
GGAQYLYTLRGVIYHGNDHFTARIITREGDIWYHDGMLTGSELIPDGTLASRVDLTTCRSRVAIVAVYALISTIGMNV